MRDIAAVILAAGKSKRMKTELPKILHPLMGNPLISYVLDAARATGVREIVLVVGHEREKIMESLRDSVTFAIQEHQLGTADALKQGLEKLEGFQGDILVLCGDMPLLAGETLINFIENHHSSNAKVSVLTGVTEHPGKLGRIIRDISGNVVKIVEAADASVEQLRIREVNTGTYLIDASYLRQILPKIGTENAQGEMYLTDIVALSGESGIGVEAMVCPDFRETYGVNNRADLAMAGEILRERINHNLMLAGVTLFDPKNTYIEASVEIGNDTTILPGCMITGKTRIQSGCLIGPHTRIENSIIGNNVEIRESVVNDSEIGDDTKVGPYAHMRPGTVIGKKGKIGNFVETKKARIGDYSKVPHLSYVGDATLGTRVNIGAGTITCNYDGKQKNPTTIEDNVFIGSNSSLVAPVTISEGSATGAGSVVTKDVPPHTLVIGNPAKKLRDI